MKKKFLSSLFALMVFCSTAFADYTTDYEITVPGDKMNMNYSQDSYNVLGTIKVSKKASDSEKNFDPSKEVVITANYSDKFMIGSATTDVQYKLCTGATQAEAKDLPSGGEITFSAASIESGTAEIELACYIKSDTSKLSAGYYFSKPKFTHKVKNVKNPEVGDIVNFGKFNGNALSWLVLDVDEKNNRALLITENCVAKDKFAVSNYEWSNSNVRAYLNGTDGNNFFTSSNFTDAEKERILNVSINKNNLSKKSDQIINSSGTDSVFLLSVKDANEYFENDEKRVSKFNNSNCRWWLRLSTQSYARAGYVSSKGKVFSDGTLVSYNTLCIRPAIWVTLSTGSTDEAKFESEIGFKKDTPSSECVIADGKSVIAMNEDEIKAKYENKTNIAITGTLDSAEELSEIIEKIGNVTMIDDLDLRELNISEVNLDKVTILNINLESNPYIKKVGSKNSSVITLNLSESSVEEIEANSCEFLEEVNLENCKKATKINFSQNYYLTKLAVKGCENLTDLSCESSELINLDIEGCTNLVKLNVKNNSLPKIKVSNENFPKLEDFTCGNQNLLRGLISSFNFNNFLQNSMISSAAVVGVSEENSELDSVKNLKAYDKSGNELVANLDKGTGQITISGEPYKLTYDYDTGFTKNGENILMDVTVEAGGEKNGSGGDGDGNYDDDDDDDEDDDDSSAKISSSGSGGCNSGFSFVSSLLLLNLTRRKFIKTRKKISVSLISEER